MSSSIGILLCGHGSHDAPSQHAFTKWANDIQQQMALPCATGYLEAQQPSINIAAKQLIEQGIKTIFAIPALLLAGRHSQKDIPLALAHIETGIEVIYLAEIIEHPKLMQAAAALIKEARTTQPLEDTPVLLIAHGSRNPQANEAVISLSQMLKQTLGLRSCTATFGQMGSPTLEHSLQALTPAASIIALPYFLFTGKPFQEIQKQIVEFSNKHPDCNITLTQTMGHHPFVLEAFCDTLCRAINHHSIEQNHNA